MSDISFIMHNDEIMSQRDVESGYASESSSEVDLPEIFFSKPHLKFLNRQLQQLEPEGEHHPDLPSPVTPS